MPSARREKVPAYFAGRCFQSFVRDLLQSDQTLSALPLPRSFEDGRD